MVPPVDVAIESVRVTTTSGRIEVIAQPGLDAVQADRLPIEVHGSTATIAAASDRASVRVPEGVDLVIGTTSGRVAVSGRVGSVAIATTSGRVRVEEAADVDVRTVSGKVEVGIATGECRIVAGSGRIEVERCGDAHVTTTSGRIDLRDVVGPAHAHCSSGKILISMGAPHDVDAETVSGRIEISMPKGTRFRVDASTSGTVPVGGDYDCVVTARSGSGRVMVT